MQDDQPKIPAPDSPDEANRPLIRHSNSYMAAPSGSLAPANGYNLEDDKAAQVGLDAPNQNVPMTAEEKMVAEMEAREKQLESGFQEG